MKKEVNEKLNALCKCEKNGRFFNLHLSIPCEGETINLIVKPLCKDSKQLAKLMFKIYKSIGE